MRLLKRSGILKQDTPKEKSSSHWTKQKLLPDRSIVDVPRWGYWLSKPRCATRGKSARIFGLIGLDMILVCVTLWVGVWGRAQPAPRPRPWGGVEGPKAPPHLPNCKADRCQAKPCLTGNI